MRPVARIVAIATGVAALGAFLVRLAMRGRIGRWGATRAEWSGKVPGDELVPNPNRESTRAVEINAPPEDIWPWLVQIGQGRGGLYSYDWLQNLFRLDIHNADSILPEFQALAVGDTVRLAPSGEGPTVRELEAGRHLVLEDTKPPWTWSFALHPVGGGRTRLVARNRVSTVNASPLVRLLYVFVAPVVFVMERKMLLGIKQRAERRHLEAEAESMTPSLS